MTLNDALLSLLEAVGATGEPHLVGWETIEQWADETLAKLLEAGILSNAKPAASMECLGCVKRCFMDVHQLPSMDKKPDRAFIVCDDPEMQRQMGRIAIPLGRLQQWKISAEQLAKVIANLIGVESKVESRHDRSDIRIGMFKGKSSRRWLLLNKSPLTLEINGYHMPMDEVLFFEDSVLSIDRDRIGLLVHKAPASAAKKYSPSAVKREAGKRRTEAMRQDWQDAYEALREENPGHTKKWYSIKLSRLPLAQGRDSETIRKQLT